MERKTKILEFNLPQMFVLQSRQPIKYMEWSRGTGKSTIIAWIILQMVRTMPRCKIALVGSTFRQILGETLPSTVEGLERFGIHKDIHYVVGKRSPHASWDEPYQAPLGATGWANCIHFWTGSVLQLVSQDKGSVERRGQNFDASISDETAQQDEERYNNEVLAGKRTWRPEFIDKPYYLSETFCSTTPMTKTGLWFLKGETLAIQDPKKFLFLRADSRYNRMNLAPGWFKEMELRAKSRMHFNAEILNIRPNLTVNGFYPMLRPLPRDGKPSHYYSATDGDYFMSRFALGKEFADTCQGDRDIDADLPLDFTFDPGAAINAAVMMQLVRGRRELRALKTFWRMSPSIVQELVEYDVIPYYAPHKTKVVNLFFDRTAYSMQANLKVSTAEIVAGIFRKHGWQVNMLAQKGVTTQNRKFHDISEVMQERDPDMIRIRINRENNRDLIISLEQSEAMENSKGQVQKDKRSEKRSGSVPRQHATDLGDAFDLPVMYYRNVVRQARSGYSELVVR